MYVVSYVDLDDFVMANPAHDSLYIYVNCVTKVYKNKRDYLVHPLDTGCFLTTQIKCLIAMLEDLRYMDSPIMIPYTTFLTDLELDWDYTIEDKVEVLNTRVLACHNRYVDYFKQLTDRADEMLQVKETFENIRRSLQKFTLT